MEQGVEINPINHLQINYKNNERKIYLTNKFTSFMERNIHNNKFTVGNAYLVGITFIQNNNFNTLVKQYIYILNKFKNHSYLIAPIKNIPLFNSTYLNENELSFGIIHEINEYKLSVLDLNCCQIIKEDRLETYTDGHDNLYLSNKKIEKELYLDKKFSTLINKKLKKFIEY